MKVAIINGKEHTLSEAAISRNLLSYLRDDLDLTGAKNGCGVGACGACTILVDDKVVKACMRTVEFIAGKSVLTIEGMAGASGGGLHPLQQSFIDHGAVQCGFCTPAMVLTAHALLLKNNNPTREQIRRGISPNLCRCTGYQQIVDAIEAAAAYYRTKVSDAQ